MKKFLIGLVAGLVGIAALAATYDETASAAPVSPGNVRIITATHDFSKQSVATNDIVKMIPIAAKSYVQAVSVEVVTRASDASPATFAVGDGSSATGWVSAVAMTSTAFAASTPTQSGVTTNIVVLGQPYALGKLYSSAGDVRLTINAGWITSGVVRVRAVVSELYR